VSGVWAQTLRLLSFSDANVRYVLAGMMLLGLAGGVLGSFTLLRKRALIGDALAHAALPGIGIAFLLTGTKTVGVLLAGAYAAGVLGILALMAIRRYSRVKEDSALAIVLTVFFGVGIVILTYIQKTGKASQSGLDKFLFGQSASLIGGEVLLIGAAAVILVAASILLYKEFKLLCFDPGYASALGFSAAWLDIILMALAVGAVVIGLQAVGVVLMAALLIIPPVTARLWTNKLGVMVVSAGVLGAISGALGSYLSFLAPKMPSGPLTVLAATSVFAVSLFIAPERGLISRMLHHRSNRRRTELENLLRATAELLEINNRAFDAVFNPGELAAIRNWNTMEVEGKLQRLSRKGLFRSNADGYYSLTVEGIESARGILQRHRLWETYLMHQAEIAADHVHRDADEMEHFLTPEVAEKLAGLLDKAPQELSSPHPLEPPEADHV
jgi:manganese/zinc/iron transport system permease protein